MDDEHDVADTGPVHWIPPPNEIAAMMEDNRKRGLYGAKIAVEAMVDTVKLLVIMYDVHGYRGKSYEQFAIIDVENKRDGV